MRRRGIHGFSAKSWTGTVDEEDIAETVALMTGIPVTRMLEGESERLLNMEKSLGERVIGQKEAIAFISEAIRRARAGLEGPETAHRELHIPRAYGGG